MEYDQTLLCQTRKVSAAEDYEVQVHRLAQMGKIIETLTTLITKSSQPKDTSAERNTNIASTAVMSEVCPDLTGGMPEKEYRNWVMEGLEYIDDERNEGCGFPRANAAQLMERKFAIICRPGNAVFKRANDEEG